MFGMLPSHRLTMVPSTHGTGTARILFLRLEGEAGADLVRVLVELLGIERGANAKGDALTEEHVVSNGGDTAVVDLGLLRPVSLPRSATVKSDCTLTNETGSRRYLVATSRPTAVPLLEFQVALELASTWLLTLW
jgi:hypothetical protein